VSLVVSSLRVLDHLFKPRLIMCSVVAPTGQKKDLMKDLFDESSDDEAEPTATEDAAVLLTTYCSCAQTALVLRQQRMQRL
jgi:hypothetical protein